MNREEIILQLLAIDPASRSELVCTTGWGIPQTNRVVDDLMRAGRVVGLPGSGSNQHQVKRLCLPATRAALLAAQKGRR